MMDTKPILEIVGLALVIIGHVAYISKKIAQMDFKIQSGNESSNKIQDDIGKLHKDLFPGGRSVFIYREDCKNCNQQIYSTIKNEIGGLKEEFISAMTQHSHVRLHERIDELQKEVIRLKTKYDI